MKPKTFVIIGSVMWVAFYIFVFFEAFNPNLAVLAGEGMWIIVYSYHTVTALVFLTAFILKVMKTLKLRSGTDCLSSDFEYNQAISKKKLSIISPQIFAIIGLLMFAFAVDFFYYAINHPEKNFPWSNEVTHIIYITYLAVMGLSFLSAIVLKIVHVLKK